MEMPALRIGNFFETQPYYEETSRVIKIKEIGKKQVHINGKWINLDELIPIIITEEILMHSGFTQFDWLKESSVFECDHFKCTLNSNGMNLFCDNLKNLKPVKYLHELQNLYFDLTGNELETNFDNIKSTKTEMA